MATDIDQAYQGWSQEELSGDESHEISVSQMLDHGSISFGRFPIESLSWERRSVFTHNRCQEELEKFNGLVAKKRAYFEERYRRIRALKAQQTRQTELTLDYGGDNSISSQSGEEDGTNSRHESLRDGAADIIHSPSEKAKVGATFKQETNCNEPLQGRCLDPQSTMPDLTPSREILGTEQDKNSIDTVLMQPLETVSSLPLTEVEDIESNYSSNLDDKEILQKQENLVSNIQPTVTQGTTLNTKKSKSHQLQSIRKYLECKPHSIVKDPSAVRNGLSLKRETKLNVVQSSKGAKTPQKMVHKAESSQPLNKTTVNRVKNNARSTLVASNGPRTETHPNIKIPGPFTLVMERRASSRGSAMKVDSRSSNKQASSLSHAKGSVQDMLKKTAITSGMTNSRGPEIKRDLKKVRNKPLELDSQYASLKKTEACVLRLPKSRSINIPARNKSISNGGTGAQIPIVKGTKRKEGHARMREPQRVTTKTTSLSMTGNMKMGTKKEATAGEAGIFFSGSKPGLGNLSHGGRKTRRETPHWR